MPLEHYEIMERIGTGKYSSVYRVRRNSDGQFLALKKVCLNKMTVKQKQNSLKQIKLLLSIKHPNIISLIEVFYDDFIDSLCLILQLADEGDLNYQIQQHISSYRPYKQEQIWSIIQQLSNGLHFLHECSIIHRDIKAGNIFVQKNGIIKIGDFNVSTVTQGLSWTRTGTLTYASPEIWKGNPYNFKSDIWSFGCLIYELMCLRKPFQGQDVEQVYKRISKCQYNKISDQYSKQLRDLVSFMIQINPKLRPSCQTILRMCQTNKKNKGSIKNLSKLTSSFSPCYNFYHKEMNISQLQKIVQNKDDSNQFFKFNKLESTDFVKHKRILHPLPSTLTVIKSQKLSYDADQTRKLSRITKLGQAHILRNNDFQIQSQGQSQKYQSKKVGSVIRLNHLHRIKFKRLKTHC